WPAAAGRLRSVRGTRGKWVPQPGRPTSARRCDAIVAGSTSGAGDS
ncbi:MAG: hypothetical protein AVDCRST_MAG64-1496, partial [uncultured Phycisphaerae bacterium]